MVSAINLPEDQQSKDAFLYDAFISYSGKDSSWVRGTLIPRLESEGLRICIDYRDFEVGVPSIVNMENAIKHSRKILLILTPNWVVSNWPEFEGLLIQTKDPTGRERRIMPLMVQHCLLPERLQIFTYLDLTNPADFDSQTKKLSAAIRSSSPLSRPIERENALFSSSQLAKYLDKLQTQILAAFRQDQYVMLTVETLESEDSDTLFALQQALRSAFGIQVQEGTEGRGRQEPLEEATSHHRLVALLGDPGIGKTTSLRSIALRQIERLRSDPSELIPVWVSLGKWVDKSLSVEDFIWREFMELCDFEVSQAALRALLTQSKLILLLDGLNELPQRELEKRGESSSPASSREGDSQKRLFDPREDGLMVLARECDSRFILSCRILEYTHLPGWREFRILPLNDSQIQDFVQRHLNGQSQRLEKILDQQPALRDLMRTPFFLRSLVRLALENWHEIPADRFQVVEFTCKAALHREAKRRGLEAERVAKIVGKESFDSMADGWIGSWFSELLKLGPKTEDDKQAQELALLDAMRCAEGAGLVIRTKEDAEQVAYRYLHQLVQEALALIYLESERFKEADYSEGRSLARIGEVHLRWGKLKEAQENLLRALELCPTVGTETLRASILLDLARVYRVWRQSRGGLKYAEAAAQLLA